MAEEAKEAPSPIPQAIPVYVCPNCGGYYCSSNVQPLDQSVNRRSSLRNLAYEDPSEWGKVISTRIRCQFCKANKGLDVDRVLVEYVRSDQVIEIIRAQVEQMYKDEEKSSGAKIARPN